MADQPGRHHEALHLAAVSGEATSGTSRFDRFVRLREVDSTNRYAADEARAGAAEGLVVVADHQAAGRGRRGRQWLEPGEGALLCSIVFRPPLELSAFARIGMLVGLSVLDMITATTGVEAALKWPNDVVLDERKVAGVLAEVVDPALGPTGRALVVGVGVNLSFADGWANALVADDGRALSEVAATLEEVTGTVVARDDALAALVHAVMRRYQDFSSIDGPERALEEYRARCSTIGRVVAVHTTSETYRARATSVSSDGRLVVRHDGARVALDAADVVHLR